jgi:hypothetical protein
MRPYPDLLVIWFCLLWLTWLYPSAHAQDLKLPADSGFINVVDKGAKGDGITDSTEALQRIFGRHKHEPGGAIREIYLPNGIYRVCGTLKWGDKKKDVRGQSRNGVIIKLEDHCPGFQDPANPKKVLEIEFGHGGQNFNQRLRNLTVDIGRNNPGAIGIGFHTNNTGGIKNVTIRSSDPQKRGYIGLSLDKAWPGPGLIQHVTIDGFDTGIFVKHEQYSMTFEHITLKDQRQVGFVNSWNTVAIHNLKSTNRVPAVKNRGRTALMALLNANLNGGDANIPAILNQEDGVLFARDIETSGYGQAIENQAGHEQNIQASRTDEFISHDSASLFPSPKHSLRLPIQEPPNIPYGNPCHWSSVTRFGAIPNDDKDDGDAIQRAIDSGADTVYLPKGEYLSRQSIHIRNQVKRLMGLAASLRFDTTDKSAFIIADGPPDAVALDVERAERSRDRYWVQHASTRTLVLRGGSYINTVPGGKVFIEDTTAVPLIFHRQQVWIRQLNTESYQHNPHIVNQGGSVWILGLKTEKDRTIIGTYEGGRTEVFGALLYKNRERIGPAPAFISEDASLSLVYRNKGKAYQIQVQEQRRDQSRAFRLEQMPASHHRMPLYISKDD